MSFDGLMSHVADHYRPEHSELSGQRKLSLVRRAVNVRLERGILAVDSLPLGDGSFAAGSFIAYLSGDPALWKEGDVLQVGGKRYEIAALSTSSRGLPFAQATVFEKDLLADG